MNKSTIRTSKAGAIHGAIKSLFRAKTVSVGGCNVPRARAATKAGASAALRAAAATRRRRSGAAARVRSAVRTVTLVSATDCGAAS